MYGYHKTHIFRLQLFNSNHIGLVHPLVAAVKIANYNGVVNALKDPYLQKDEVEAARKIIFDKRQPLMVLSRSKTPDERTKVARYTTIMNKVDEWLAAHSK